MADTLLKTTRSVRKRLDLTRDVEKELVEECIEVALQAPSSAHPEHWGTLAFVAVSDSEKKAQIAEHYRDGLLERLQSRPLVAQTASLDDGKFERVFDSSMHLAENLHKVPVLVFPCIKGRIEHEELPVQAAAYGSVLPSAWSFMLAARSRGLGTAWTTVHLFREREIGRVLGIPDDWSQVVLIPVAYYTGTTFREAARPPVQLVTHWERWDSERYAPEDARPE